MNTYLQCDIKYIYIFCSTPQCLWKDGQNPNRTNFEKNWPMFLTRDIPDNTDALET